MSNNNNGTNSFVLILLGAFGLGMLFNLFGANCSSPPAAFDPTPAVSNDSFERRYVKERFKQEGFSADEAAQAADAVLKFHNAQQRRQR